MTDLVTSLYVSFAREVEKLRGSVKDAFLKANANGKHQRP